ncbi:hypothetical protein PRIPAC_92580 [Pristionchus pacificus]|uniref:Uncharacterized protein n=1 Tax=Pristionchus pacificus TaxID=54126 RepID=A0A2A6CHY4_PRIPA|nr:hypothetical protein PRIPAC_92580 [Pristionchus pacificus]|eukprot:PDM77700.1 hypothetical protein PRIPAC_34567 [Pristionchus pacificus]
MLILCALLWLCISAGILNPDSSGGGDDLEVGKEGRRFRVSSRFRWTIGARRSSSYREARECANEVTATRIANSNPDCMYTSVPQDSSAQSATPSSHLPSSQSIGGSAVIGSTRPLNGFGLSTEQKRLQGGGTAQVRIITTSFEFVSLIMYRCNGSMSAL